jgi:DNA-binding MarR family transcriptional regulator
VTDAAMPDPGLRDTPGALGAALRRARAGYRHRMHAELAAAGFADRQPPDGRVLRVCAAPGETTISDVGRALGISRQGASKVVAGLRERGYLEVTPSAADSREKILTLTQRAADFIASWQAASAAVEAWLRTQIGDDGIDRLYRYLDTLADDASPPPSDAPGLRALRWQDAAGEL